MYKENLLEKSRLDATLALSEGFMLLLLSWTDTTQRHPAWDQKNTGIDSLYTIILKDKKPRTN